MMEADAPTLTCSPAIVSRFAEGLFRTLAASSLILSPVLVPEHFTGVFLFVKTLKTIKMNIYINEILAPDVTLSIQFDLYGGKSR